MTTTSLTMRTAQKNNAQAYEHNGLNDIAVAIVY